MNNGTLGRAGRSGGKGAVDLRCVWTDTEAMSIATTVLQQKSGVWEPWKPQRPRAGRMGLLPSRFFLPAGCRRLRTSFEA